MKEIMDEIMSGKSLTEAVMDHKGTALRIAVILVVLVTGLFFLVYQGEEDIVLTDVASGEIQEEGSDGQQRQGPTGADALGGADGEGETADPAPTESATLFVDIGGAVKEPKLAELPQGSRVEDAIKQAGGVTESADLTSINRAALLSDGEKIYIPKRGEAVDPSVSGGTVNEATGAAGSTGAGALTGKVNLNTADLSQLQTLPGVGPVTAQKIIDYRAQAGGFSSIEDLKNVSGIGDKTFEKMKDGVTI